jgi:hypothetical protein
MAITSESNFAAEAGEHYVLFRLYRQGVLAGQAPRGTSAVDLLVQRPDRTSVEVQVKTRAKHAADGGWHLRAKHETMKRPRLLYAFLNVEDPLNPVAYVVPSAKVAEVISNTHRVWLKTPGKGGKAHKDSDVRRLCPSYGNLDVPYQEGWLEEYRERWDLIVGEADPSNADPQRVAQAPDRAGPSYPDWFAFEADVTLRGVLHWVDAARPDDFRVAEEWRSWYDSESRRELRGRMEDLLSGRRPER